eukprot:TRINITY_DN5521_c0_g2_i2.p1 TRINITY_DN5521_c0_g2~~TRINITY_DN5521_c0_g2_i2.p1  ORF type:complete len:681 (+),score=115.47 TRINITY_DN5521_c0_g2_i2:1306-3348(+)
MRALCSSLHTLVDLYDVCRLSQNPELGKILKLKLYFTEDTAEGKKNPHFESLFNRLGKKTWDEICSLARLAQSPIFFQKVRRNTDIFSCNPTSSNENDNLNNTINEFEDWEAWNQTIYPNEPKKKKKPEKRKKRDSVVIDSLGQSRGGGDIGGYHYMGSRSRNYQNIEDDEFSQKRMEDLIKMKYRHRGSDKGAPGGKANNLNWVVGDILHGKRKDEIVFLGIIDARHAPLPPFMQIVLPYFWRSDDKIRFDRQIRFVQVPQCFPEVLSTFDDWADRQNGLYYWLISPLRNFSGTSTSIGTNCVWNISPPSGGDFRFNTKSVSEDTLTSHDELLLGNRTVYLPVGLVSGCTKDEISYLQAVCRWSGGGTEMWLLNFDNAYQWLVALAVHGWTLGYWCLICFTINKHVWVWVLSLICSVTAVVLCHRSEMVRVHLVIYVNTSSWYQSSTTAVWWTIVFPLFLSLGSTFDANPPILIIYGMSLFLCQSTTVHIAKSWAHALSENAKTELIREFPVMNSAKLSELHLKRSSQLWALLWPLHVIGWFFVRIYGWTPPPGAIYFVTKVLIPIHLGILITGIIYPFIDYITGASSFMNAISSGTLSITSIAGSISCLIWLVSLWGPGIVLITGRPFVFSSRHTTFIIILLFSLSWFVLNNSSSLELAFQALLPESTTCNSTHVGCS